MKIEVAHQVIEQTLSRPRYEHTIRVAETAEQLAERFNVSTKDALLAGLLHDYAKEYPVAVLQTYITQFNLPNDLLEFHHELWHAPVGAKLLEQKYPELDRAVILAIKFHTTGRANMTPLEKILFVADYIEPGRTFAQVEEVRELAIVNIDKAVQRALRNTLVFLASKNVTIYPDTLYAYNELTNNKEDDSIHGNKRTSPSSS